LPVNQRGDAQHLAHPGATDGAFIADDENVTFAIFAVANGIDAVFLVFEYPGSALEYQVLEAGNLINGAVGQRLPFRTATPPSRMIGLPTLKQSRRRARSPRHIPPQSSLPVIGPRQEPSM